MIVNRQLRSLANERIITNNFRVLDFGKQLYLRKGLCHALQIRTVRTIKTDFRLACVQIDATKGSILRYCREMTPLHYQKNLMRKTIILARSRIFFYDKMQSLINLVVFPFLKIFLKYCIILLELSIIG